MRTSLLPRQARAPDATLALDATSRATIEPRLGIRPPLKWAGGKRWQVPFVRDLWRGHEDRRLVEPFCGGLAITLSLLPKRAIVNDVNPHLMNFYRWVKRGLVTRLPMDYDEDRYYRHRDRFNGLLQRGKETSREAASLFYYLNRTGYNGLCRFNSSGEFNVPFGRYTTVNYTRDFSSYRPVVAGWQFTCGDFTKIALRPGDFIYADPPYDVEFTHYSKDGFTWDDQLRAAEWLSRHQGPVVLSNQATPRIVKLYKSLGFALRYLQAPRLISCNGDRTPAKEVLALKNF